MNNKKATDKKVKTVETKVFELKDVQAKKMQAAIDNRARLYNEYVAAQQKEADILEVITSFLDVEPVGKVQLDGNQLIVEVKNED